MHEHQTMGEGFMIVPGWKVQPPDEPHIFLKIFWKFSGIPSLDRKWLMQSASDILDASGTPYRRQIV